MSNRTTAVVSWLFVLGLTGAMIAFTSGCNEAHASDGTPLDEVKDFANQMIVAGRQTFRFDTFGDETFWGDQLQLHQAINGSVLGGVGPGLSPALALSLGLKVDPDSLSNATRNAIADGTANL